MERKRFTRWLLGALILLCGCVENDLPYPTIVGEIEEFAVEGQTSIKINKAEGSIAVKVVDTLDLRDLRVEKLVVTEGMRVIPDSSACKSFTHFPDSGFISADSLPATANAVYRIHYKLAVATPGQGAKIALPVKFDLPA